MVELEDLVKEFDGAYAKAKKKECEEFYNAIITAAIERKVSPQNILFSLKMVEWALLRSYYMQWVEEAVQIPDGVVPVKKIKTEESA